MSDKAEWAYRTISEVSEQLDVPSHVLRFWETKFTQLKPMKRSGGRRYYNRADLELLTTIRDLLYRDGFTIKGAQKALKEKRAHPEIVSGADQLPQPSQSSQPSQASHQAQTQTASDNSQLLTSLMMRLQSLDEKLAKLQSK